VEEQKVEKVKSVKVEVVKNRTKWDKSGGRESEGSFRLCQNCKQ